MDQHSRLLNAYQTAQEDLKKEYPVSQGYWVDYDYNRGRKTHTVKVFKSGLSGEGTTKDDKEGASKAVYEKSEMKNKKLSSGDSYTQAVYNYVLKDKGEIKDEVNARGKATVTVWNLLVEKSSSEASAGPVHYAALCALRASTK